MFHLCLDGDGCIDWTGLAALKTHVSLDEAFLLEAVKCAAGDARHDFQLFYAKWSEEQRTAAKDMSKVGELNPTQVLREVEMTRQAIDEHEALLSEHRLTVVDGKSSPYSDADIDAIHATVASLRNNLPAMEAELAHLLEQHRDAGSGKSR